jgi:DNA repair protein RecO (recombination protein O)
LFVKVAVDLFGWYGADGSPVPPELATSAFVLHTRAYGESDRIVTLLTEQHGKIVGIAKGAKNSRRRFGGTLEPFLHIRVVFQARSSSDLVFLLRCELLENHRSFTRDLDRFAAGSYVLELTDRMVLGRESGRDVYRLVRDALTLLDAGAPQSALLRAFDLHLLRTSGYAPAFDRCRGCGEAVAAATRYLSVERGGLLCRACVRPGEVVRPVGADTARLLALLADGPLASAAATAGNAPSGDGMLEEAAVVAEHLLSAVTTGPVRSRAFLARTRVDSPDTLR